MSEQSSGRNLSQRLTEKLKMAFSPDHLIVQNDSNGHARGNETHFTVVIVSQLFQGKTRVDRQRMVAALFDEEREDGLHALSQKTFTPEEWSKVKDDFKVEVPACQGQGLNKTPAK